MTRSAIAEELWSLLNEEPQKKQDVVHVHLRLLLQALRGYQIDSTTNSHAIDRILHSPGPQKTPLRS